VTRNINAILVSLVIPVMNEQASVGVFLKTVHEIFQQHNINVEYIFVNDGSKDNTLPLLLQLKELYPLVVVDFARNFGKEAALTAGLQHARGDVVIPIDVDLQHLPRLMLEMLERWQQGVNHVIAIRQTRKEDSWFKRVTSTWFYKFFNFCSSCEIPAHGGDFRLLDWSIVNHLLSLKENNRFMKGLFAWVGGEADFIYFDCEKRAAGSTSFNLVKLIRLAWNGIASFSTFPLRVWGYLGVGISMISFLYALWSIIKVVIFGRDVPGYASLMVGILFLGGVQLISISVLGEYIGKVFLEVKRRPLYLISKIYKSDAHDGLGVELTDARTEVEA